MYSNIINYSFLWEKREIINVQFSSVLVEQNLYKLWERTTQSSNRSTPRDQTSVLGPEGRGASMMEGSLEQKQPWAITSGGRYDGYLRKHRGTEDTVMKKSRRAQMWSLWWQITKDVSHKTQITTGYYKTGPVWTWGHLVVLLLFMIPHKEAALISRICFWSKQRWTTMMHF